MHFTKLLFTGEEFMVLENIIGEKFMIPWKNIHPWYTVDKVDTDVVENFDLIDN